MSSRVIVMLLNCVAIAAFCVGLSIMLAPPAQADSKAETALRAQLAIAAADLAAAAKERTALQQSIAKTGAENKAAIEKLAAQGKKQAADATAQRDTSDALNDQNAAEARAAAATADLASSRAELATVLAHAQADALLKAADTNKLALYGTLGTGVCTLLLGFASLIAKDRSDARTEMHRELELRKIDEVKATAADAFIAANNVNEKIASVGLRMADDGKAKPE